MIEPDVRTLDPFQTGPARRAVLAAWTGSAHRFREDANSEEDLVLGGYRDRVVVELAQNAADAAQAAGVPGRLLLRLEQHGDHGVLIAANTGAPLDLDGVRALASLRASAKRGGDTVGRFGVGFSAVLAVTDEPAVLGRSGGVRFSARETRQQVMAVAGQAPELAAELDRRQGHVPILRLPFDTQDQPPPGYDTAVVLPLRDAAAADLVRLLLGETGDPLLLALPGLTEIVIEVPDRPVTVLRDAGDRWHVLRREGQLDPGLVSARPVEERQHTRWQVTWALPRQARPVQPGEPDPAQHERVFHAPTPSDEPMTLPALLIATLPLDPSRRHIAPGPVASAVIEHAAAAYAELVAQLAQDGLPTWPLVPVGLPAGALDGALRSAVSQRLPGVPMLPAADEPSLLLRPRDALAMAPPVGSDERAVPELASWVAGLVLAPRAADAAFSALGVRRLGLAELVEELPQAADAHRWRRLYDVLAPYAADSREREALSSIGVPLAGGQVARGARGLLLGTDGVPAAALARLGVKVVDPAAAHPLLERLGATAAGPRAVLDLPAVRSAVLAPPDWHDDPGYLDLGTDGPDVSEAVLQLVAAAVQAGQLAPGDLPWLGELEIEDQDGDPAPAGALALPGSPAAAWFDPDDVGLVSQSLVDRWGAAVLSATGVLSGPGLWHGHDLALDEPGQDWEPDDDPGDPHTVLDGWEQWCEEALDQLRALPQAAGEVLGAVVPELRAVRDLDVVRPAALPDLVATLAGDPALRPALVDPVRVLAGGLHTDVLGHTAWWLRRELTGGAAAGPGAEPGLSALLPPAPDWIGRLDPAAAAALGVVTRLDDLDAPALPHLLDRLADNEVPVTPGLLLRVLRRLAELSGDGAGLPEPPARVRAWSPAGTRVVDAGQACVVDAPMYLQRPDLGWPLPVPSGLAGALADLLDLPLARELAAGQIDERGAAGGVPQRIDPAILELAGAAPGTGWCEHEELRVDGVEVDWWVDDDGLAHAATLDGLARAMASASGRWHLRDVLSAALLAEPGQAGPLLAQALADETFTAG